MTTTSTNRPRLINARGQRSRPLVEMAISPNANAPHPATGGVQWSDPEQAATVISAIEKICGSKKLTDIQRIPEIQKILADAESVAKQVQPKPATPLNESKSRELIESQRPAGSAKTFRPRLSQQSCG